MSTDYIEEVFNIVISENLSGTTKAQLQQKHLQKSTLSSSTKPTSFNPYPNLFHIISPSIIHNPQSLNVICKSLIHLPKQLFLYPQSLQTKTFHTQIIALLCLILHFCRYVIVHVNLHIMCKQGCAQEGGKCNMSISFP